MAIVSNPQYYRYHYIPSEMVLSLDVPYTFRANTVTYMNLIFDYVSNRLPVIQVGIECNNYIIAQIYKHKDIAKMTIVVDEQKQDSEGNVLGTAPFIKETLTIIPALDQTAYITDTDLDLDERTDYAKMLQRFEFYLVDMDWVNLFNAKRNFSVKDTTFPAIFQSLFVSRNIPANKIIASPPVQLDTKLPKVVLPLNTLIGNIKTLNTKYGLYDCDPIIFWDMKYLYCLNKREPNTQMEDTATDFGTVTFTLYNPDDEHHLIRGSYDDPDTSTHYINLESPPHIRDDTYQDSHTKTSTIITVDKDGTVDNDTTIDENATKATYIYAENELTKKQVLNEMITGPTVDVVAKDSSVKFLRPYKDYNFQVGSTYENLNLTKRTFRLLQYSLGIRRDGSAEYINDVGMVLYCPERNIRETEADTAEEDE